MPYFPPCNTARMKRPLLCLFLASFLGMNNLQAEDNPDASVAENAPESNEASITANADMSKERLEEISLDQLTVLAKNGKYDQGYEMSKQLLDEWEGDPRFDFYYGLHALETGHFDEATFVFERLTAFDPNTLRYRLELARALYFNNNTEHAKTEFQIALKSNPPDQVKANIKKFLKRINRSEVAAKHRFNGMVGLTSGFDSNINSGTEEEGIEFPDIGYVALQDESRSQDSMFKQLNTRAYYSFSHKPRHSIDVSVSTYHKRNDEVSDYDLDVINLFTGYSWQPKYIRVQGGLTDTRVKLDGDDYQNQQTLTGSAIYTTQSLTSFGFSANLGSRASDNDNLPDADVMTLSANVSWPDGLQKYTNISLYGGSEKVSDSELEHFGKTYFGLTYLSRYLLTSTFARIMQGSVQNNQYQADNPTFEDTRSDTAVMGGWGYEWTPWKLFSWRADITISHNASNLDLYTYYRAIVSTGISFQF